MATCGKGKTNKQNRNKKQVTAIKGKAAGKEQERLGEGAGCQLLST